MIHLVATLAATTTTTPPPYTYDGLMIPPTTEWVMFEPYKEFVVGDHICRAYDQPDCTWWNAMFLESMNASLLNASGTEHITVGDKLLIGVPWIPERKHVEVVEELDEIPCIQGCLATNCSAVTWLRQENICAMTHDTVHIDASKTTMRTIREQKIPMYRSYVVRGHGIDEHDVRRFIDHLLDLLGCRLKTFRCA